MSPKTTQSQPYENPIFTHLPLTTYSSFIGMTPPMMPFYVPSMRRTQNETPSSRVLYTLFQSYLRHKIVLHEIPISNTPQDIGSFRYYNVWCVLCIEHSIFTPLFHPIVWNAQSVKMHYYYTYYMFIHILWNLPQSGAGDATSRYIKRVILTHLFRCGSFLFTLYVAGMSEVVVRLASAWKTTHYTE